MATEIILEPIIDDNANVTIEPPPADDEVESPPEPIVEAVEEVPVKRPRGRPKGKAAPKAPPKPKAVPKAPKLQRAVTTRRKPEPEYSDSSTSEEDMVGRLLEDDMSTQVLRFLTARKRDQESKRRNLWQNLASSGLR
jgi:outer membrane biosynthesis protein TonB